QLLHSPELDVEHERRVGRNRTQALGAIRQLGRDGQLALAAHPHPLDTEAPASDPRADTERELDRRARVVGAVELRPIREPARVVRGYDLARRRGRAAADLQVLDRYAADHANPLAA